MKSDLISRSRLKTRLTMLGVNGAKSHVRAYARCVNEVETAPAVDAVPVVHGRWIEVRNKHSEKVGEKCCPNCGAKMDGDGHE